jgi:hypothetical protein
MEFKLCPNDGNKVTIRECEQREGTTWELEGNWLEENERWGDLKDGKGKIAPIAKKDNVFFGSITKCDPQGIGLKGSIGPSPSNFKDIKSHTNHDGYAVDAFWLWEKNHNKVNFILAMNLDMWAQTC